MIKVHFETETGSPGCQAWHDWRANGVGASDSIQTACKAGLTKKKPSWANSNKLLAQKLGLAKPTAMNSFMQKGVNLESTARRRFEEDTGIIVMPTFGEMDSHRFMRASFDGVSFFKDILEIKCPSEEVHNMAKEGVVVPYYLPQLAHQCLVLHGEPKNWTGNERVFFATYNPDDSEGHDLAIVPMVSGQLKQLASQLLNVNTNFFNKMQSLAKGNFAERFKNFEKKHEGLLTTFGEAEATSKAAKEFLRDAVINHKYIPQHFTVKPSTRKNKNFNSEEVLAVLGWDDVPPEYRKASSIVVNVNKPEVAFTSALDAEKAQIESDLIVKSLTPEMDKVKEDAAKLIALVGYLQGNLMTVYKRKGNVNWDLVLSDTELTRSSFEHPSEDPIVTIAKINAAKVKTKAA